MAGSLHGSARTTPRVRAALQASRETSGALTKRYGLSRNTVTEWRVPTTTEDAPMGPRAPHSTVLTVVEEAMVVEVRQRTLLPLDDVLGCLRDSIPKLTRSSLHRCLERHDISRLPESPDHASKRGKFAETPIGYVHIDISERHAVNCAWPGASSPCSSPSTGSRSFPTSSSETPPERSTGPISTRRG